MRNWLSIFLRAFIIAVLSGSLGLLFNMSSDKKLPLVYIPPQEITIAGLKVPVINEKEAFALYDSPDTTFVDTRKREDYMEGHIKGAVFLTPENMEELFPEAEPLMPPENKLVLYCYGPECDMAEQVAAFISKLGYTNLAIMSSGMRAWERAGYPIQGSSRTTHRDSQPRTGERSEPSRSLQ